MLSGESSKNSCGLEGRSMSVESVARTDAVVGFAFSDDFRTVLLIRKRKPASQAGLLNGVGGKVEPGESFIDAMIREFSEEAGINTLQSDWTHFASLNAPRWRVAFFKATLPQADLIRVAAAPPLTHETLELHSLVGLRDQETMRNLRWMVPFCLDSSPYVLPVELKEREEP